MLLVHWSCSFKYDVVILHPYLTNDQLRLQYVQNRFLSFAAYILKMPPLNHNYLHICCVLNLPSLADRHTNIKCLFINSLLNNFLDAHDLLTRVSFILSSHNTINLTPFYISFHSIAMIILCVECSATHIRFILLVPTLLIYFLCF